MTSVRASRATGLSALVLAGAALLAGCGGSTVTAILSTVGGPEVVASGFAFEQTTLDVTAGEPFGLELVNEDNAPHNLSIYRDASASDKLFGGEIFSGPASRLYSIPALPAGTWFFRCDVHTAMHGSIVASDPIAPASP